MSCKNCGVKRGRDGRARHWSLAAATAMSLALVALHALLRPVAPPPQVSATAPSYPSLVRADHPVAYWRLGETGGTAAHDSAGANTAAYGGTPTHDTLGAIEGDENRATVFRGESTGDAVQTPASASLDLRQGTLEVWFKADNVRDNQKIFVLSTTTDTDDKFILGISAGQFYPELRTAGGAIYAAVTGTVAAGVWYHFVATYRPADRFFRAYVNGQQLVAVATDGQPLVSAGRARATIGGWGGVGFWFAGAVDEAAVYDHALTAAQVRAHYDAARYVFGTLLSDTRYIARDYAAGVRASELELGWSRYEPRDGVFSDPTVAGSYAYTMRQALWALRAAGMKVILGVGLQYPPDWVFSYPGSRYVDQRGVVAPGYVNLTFSQTLRAKAEAYIARVNADLGLNSFWAVRVGSGPQVEVLLPQETGGGGADSYWAYDADAQGAAGDRPATIPANPYPGWQPGQTSYAGQPFSTAQVGQWLDWYLFAVMDGVNWQIAAYKRLGYTGYIHVAMPGWGTRPREYATAVAHYLNGAGDGLRTLGRGAVWDRDIDKIADRRNVVIDISSVDDSSSSVAGGAANLCRPDDGAVRLDDPRILQWSSTRWLAYNARRDGLPVIGETPDKGSATPANPYGPRMMRAAAALMQACGLQGLQWAFDGNLYDGTSGVTARDYAAVIARYPH